VKTSSLPSKSSLLWFAGVLLLASLCIRLCFWRATPDWEWAYSAYYKGDAPRWLDFVRAVRDGETFEWDLPFRPPGMAYLLGLLWDGTMEGLGRIKLAWCILGATIPSLFFLASVRAFGLTVAALAGVGMAASTGLLFLSTSINNEIPYLALVGLGLLLLTRAARHPSVLALAFWSALNGITCLLRVEHVLFFGLCGAYLLVSWVGRSQRIGWSRALPMLVLCIVCFLIPLVPWHVSAWDQISRFNSRPAHLGQATENMVEQIETMSKGMSWAPGALERRGGLPAFGAHAWSAMVTATMGYRGETTIQGRDFDILEQAFGYYPEPVTSHPFITLYGPINFFLANNRLSGGGFGREALEVPPPLRGGEDQYPSFFAKNFPPEGDLSLWYLPHLQVVNRGYELGWEWIRENPLGYVMLIGRKLERFWAGASLGFGGYGFPVGISGPRYRVDLVVPDSSGAVPWNLAVLVVCVAGLLATIGNRETHPWLFFLVSKLVVVWLFFGYARIGATVAPVICLLVAAGLDRWIIRPLALWCPGSAVGGGRPLFRWIRGWSRFRRTLAWGSLIMALAVSLEVVRFLNPPEIHVRERKIGPEDPYPEKLYIDQRINVRRDVYPGN
jgi:hypothetical protein